MRGEPFSSGHAQLAKARQAARRGNVSRVRTLIRAAVLVAESNVEVSEA